MANLKAPKRGSFRASNCHRDRLRSARRPNAIAIRRDARRDEPMGSDRGRSSDIVRGWKDELLALLFACCHPALDDARARRSHWQR